jgi:predicted O-methyltransferase YrrM
VLRAIKGFLKKAPVSRGIVEHLRREGRYPSGHYYSPIPSQRDVRAYLAARKPPLETPAGIDMNEQDQRRLLEEYSRFYEDAAFEKEQGPSRRYYYNNYWFGYSDAFFLYSYLRKNQPRRIIEVGSGFSSAVMLDTIDAVYSQKPEITFIEPYTLRLDGLLRDTDRDYAKVIDKKVQEVPVDAFTPLGSGDLLFVDSSHVVKCGSDVQLLLFDIMPHLKSGVTVHFHDVIYPFEYPDVWLREGRYWNESYFLRAFLSYNSEWRILSFVNYLHHKHGDMIQTTMPLCGENPGGSLYIQRR